MGVSLLRRFSRRSGLTTNLFSRITQREPEAKETWRAMDEQRRKEFREGPFSNLPYVGGELVRTAVRIIKVST